MSLVRTALLKVVMLTFSCLALPQEAWSAKSKIDTLLHRVFSYPQTIEIRQVTDTASYAYMKSSLRVNKRNVLLMAIPTMYMVVHGGSREYIQESFNKVSFLPSGPYTTEKLLSLSTIPRRHVAMPTLTNYLAPNVYDVTMIGEDILSPFNKQNKIYYKYSFEQVSDSLVRLRFKPRLKNTLLVNGVAIVTPQDGRIVQVRLAGEYDMIRFRLLIKMGSGVMHSLRPEKCNLDARFMFLGNDIMAHYTMDYNLPKPIVPLIEDDHDPNKMRQIRPEPLTPYEKIIYGRLVRARNAAGKDTAGIDSLSTGSRWMKTKTILWDKIGENVLTHINQKFGPNQQGYLRINPILNPLFMGYSNSQGFYYKFNIRGGYKFTDNSDIWLQFKAGYSFKLKQFYFWAPLIYNFDKQHNAYLKTALSGGRHIKNRRLINELNLATDNNPIWENMQLDEYKDTYWDCFANYDLSKHIGFQAGLILHHRSALHKEGFELINKPRVYSSLAPKLQVLYRPWGYAGPTLTASYEQSLNKLANTNVPYTRWEFDGQYILPLWNVQSLSMRLGGGFYTHRTNNDYFVDYENFRQTFLPDGWTVDWSGEFELLDSDLYNLSLYYARANFAYESPFLILAWLPFAGHFIERERLYFSALHAKHAHPYIELGYAFKTRLASVGAFVSTVNGKYRNFGFKFGFELFRQW